jgi:hypothetical protein
MHRERDASQAHETPPNILGAKPGRAGWPSRACRHHLAGLVGSERERLASSLSKVLASLLAFRTDGAAFPLCSAVPGVTTSPRMVRGTCPIAGPYRVVRIGLLSPPRGPVCFPCVTPGRWRLRQRWLGTWQSCPGGAGREN